MLPAQLCIRDELCEVRGCLLVNPIGQPGRFGAVWFVWGLRISVKSHSVRGVLLSLNLRALLQHPYFALFQYSPAIG